MLEAIRTALVLAPHPDDEVLGCGGTIARLSKRGAEVHVAIVTRADPPRFAEGLVATGRKEAASAHALLGTQQIHYLDFPAAELDQVPQAEINHAFSTLCDTIRPDTVFVPFIGDVHADHQIVFQSAMVAARPRDGSSVATILAYETLSETNWYAPGITPTFAPNAFIDISETLDIKQRAFACFASQVKAFPDERSPEAIAALARLRGANVYRVAAEAFMLVRAIV